MVSGADFKASDPGVRRTSVRAGWLSTERGRHLRGRRNEDTSAERLLRQALHRQGARFRLQRQITPNARADIVFPRDRLAVFVDGCFWHGCPQHGRSTFSGPNATLWMDKMERNRRRDARALVEAAASGWRVIRLWECAVLGNPSAASEQVLYVLKEAGSLT